MLHFSIFVFAFWFYFLHVFVFAFKTQQFSYFTGMNMTDGLDPQEFDSIFAKLNVFLFLENLGSVVAIEKRPAENGLFLRIIPRAERRETWTDDCNLYDDQINNDEDDTHQSFSANSQEEMLGLSNGNGQANSEFPEASRSTRLETNPNSEKSDNNDSDLPSVRNEESNGAAEAHDGIQSAKLREAEKSYVHVFAKQARKRYFCCKRCPMAFDKPGQLIRHRETVHLEEINEPFKTLCTKCNLSFPNRGAIMKHWWREHREHKCRVCSQVFPDSESQKKHAHIVHGKDPYHEAPKYFCSKCEYSCTNKWTMQNHRKNKHSGKIFSCPECKKVLSTQSGLLRHVKEVHANERKLECKLCLKKIADQIQMRRHEKTRHLFSCNKCKLILTTARARMQHGIDAHNENVPLDAIFPDVCVKCQEPLSSFNDYASHQQMHAKERKAKSQDVLCKSCNERFNDDKTLILHMQSVHNIECFQCPQCSFYTFKQIKLRRHERIVHPSSEMIFTCESCSTQFPTYKLRQEHKKNEHKRSKNICSLCQHVFFSFPKYQLHAANDHQFDCSLCDLKFVNKFSLTQHVKKMHAETA